MPIKYKAKVVLFSTDKVNWQIGRIDYVTVNTDLVTGQELPPKQMNFIKSEEAGLTVDTTMEVTGISYRKKLHTQTDFDVILNTEVPEND